MTPEQHLAELQQPLDTIIDEVITEGPPAAP